MITHTNTSLAHHASKYVCPRCRIPVVRQGTTHICNDCGAQYPILCGIPDFRIAPDQYLTLEEERAKAEYLHIYSQTHSFAETVAEYYQITDDVPTDMRGRFANYVMAGEVRGRTVIGHLPQQDTQNKGLLDVGCGAGGTLVAAARAGQTITGIDIALRWLVIAQKRLAEEELSGELVCGDIANPPFANASFERISATDLFEHLPDPTAGAKSIGALLVPHGQLYATGANQFTLAIYSPAGLWGVGFLQTTLRRKYVVWRRGIDTLRFLAMHSPGSLTRLLVAAGFEDVHTSPMTVEAERGLGLGPSKRLQIFLYRLLCGFAPTRALLLKIGPAFEVTARLPKRTPINKRTAL